MKEAIAPQNWKWEGFFPSFKTCLSFLKVISLLGCAADRFFLWALRWNYTNFIVLKLIKIYFFQYTILERNRTQFTDTGGKLSKQKKVIDIFRKEQNNILTDLAVASADARKKEDQRRSKEISKLLREFDEFDSEIKTKKNHLVEIDEQIKMVKKKVWEDKISYILFISVSKNIYIGSGYQFQTNHWWQVPTKNSERWKDCPNIGE